MRVQDNPRLEDGSTDNEPALLTNPPAASDGVILGIFPEGTRSRSGEIGTGKPGVGRLIYEARPMVIPVRMMGMENVLGVGHMVPRMFQTVRVFIGKPLDLSDMLDAPLPVERSREIDFYRKLAERVVRAIKALGPQDS